MYQINSFLACSSQFNRWLAPCDLNCSGGGMERTDVQRMADSVLRDYGVPMKVSAISAADAGWPFSLDSWFRGFPVKLVDLQCDRTSAHHVRESLRGSLSLRDCFWCSLGLRPKDRPRL